MNAMLNEFQERPKTITRRKFRWKATCYGVNIRTFYVLMSKRPETVAVETPTPITVTFLDSEFLKDFYLMELIILDGDNQELEKWIFDVEVKNVKAFVEMETNLLKVEMDTNLLKHESYYEKRHEKSHF